MTAPTWPTKRPRQHWPRQPAAPSNNGSHNGPLQWLCQKLVAPEWPANWLYVMIANQIYQLELCKSKTATSLSRELCTEQLTSLQDPLDKQKAAFSIDGSIGETGLCEHEIELLENVTPIAEPLRRRPLLHKAEAERQVDKMLEEGIIEHSASPWASAYVLVKKKGGELRMCIDFRKLNDKTTKNAYPMPNNEECLDALSGNRFFSSLDFNY